MKYHKSKYNYIYKKERNKWVVYNTFSGAIIVIDEKHKKKYDDLVDYQIDSSSVFISNLVKQGILVDNNHDEKQLLDSSRIRRAYGEKSAYLRILTTTACNARCSYCYEKGFKVETMTEKTADSLIKYILSLPKMEKFYIHWFGGEPLLNIKIIDKVMISIYDKLKKYDTDIYVYFTSNGSLLDKEMSHKAKTVWHANYFQITIDGIGNEYNSIKNYVKKKYNYDKVVKNIEYLLKENIMVILRINYYPNEINKTKLIVDKFTEKFKTYCDKKLLIFDLAPIFESGCSSCSDCKKKYNMFEPNLYLVEKNLISIDDAFKLKLKGGQCYACHQGSFVVAPNGDLYKCTVTLNDENAKVGSIFNGVDRNCYYFKWVNPKLPKKCDKCVFLPLCQGGCRAGELKYLNVLCNRNLSEIQSIINYKIDQNIRLKPLKECINKDVYDMYQDIPPEEVGSTNNMFNISYEDFKLKCEEYIKEETVINEELNTTTNRYILYDLDEPIGEVGIRTTLNDFWMNRGSQIYYKIKKSERSKGYGNIILKLALLEAKKIGFKKIRINCDDKNIYSKKIIIKNGGIEDIKSYKTNKGYSTSYIINLENN